MTSMGYINPKSVTFWAGALLILKVLVKGIFDVDIPISDEVLAGAGIIGLRRAVN